MSHRGRINPSQGDTLEDLHKVLKVVPQGDCICVLGDLNEQLVVNVQGTTGAWTGGPPSKNSDKMVELLQMYNLQAANTFFEPKKNKSAHAYMYTETKAKACGQDLGLYVGERVRCEHDGQEIDGDVIAAERTDDTIFQDSLALRWTIRFDDEHMRCAQAERHAKES